MISVMDRVAVWALPSPERVFSSMDSCTRSSCTVETVGFPAEIRYKYDSLQFEKKDEDQIQEGTETGETDGEDVTDK